MLDFGYLFVSIYKDTKYGGCRQVVKTTDCGSVMRGFESHHPPHKTDFDFCRGLFYIAVLRSFEEPNRPIGLSGFERVASRGRSRFCLWLYATKSKMRRPVYCEQLKTIPPLAQFLGVMLEIFCLVSPNLLNS